MLKGKKMHPLLRFLLHPMSLVCFVLTLRVSPHAISLTYNEENSQQYEIDLLDNAGIKNKI